jgi:chitinase domain-containing protein 1
MGLPVESLRVVAVWRGGLTRRGLLHGRNARGYEIAKRFRGKLSHIAPVWFQLRGAAHAPEITGRQDVDLEWIHAVRGGSPEECATEERAAVRVVPRVVVELGGQEQIQLLRNEAAAAMSVEVLVSLISQYELDGLTLEVRALLGV